MVSVRSSFGASVLPVLFVLLGSVLFTWEQTLSYLVVPFPQPDNLHAIGMMFADATGLPVGVEGMHSAGAALDEGRSRIARSLNLSGLTPAEAVVELGSHLPDGYTASLNGGRLLIRRASQSELDQIVPEFSVEKVGLVEAAHAVRRLFDPEAQQPFRPLLPPPGMTEDRLEKQARERANEKFRPVVSVRLANATLERILNEIATSYGKASWTVLYTSPECNFKDAVLGFMVPRGVSVQLGPMGRRTPRR